MRAGEEAGGDKRGRQAAGLKIHRGERYVHVAQAFATTGNFSGATDRAPIDAAIASDAERRHSAGHVSRSHATENQVG